MNLRARLLSVIGLAAIPGLLAIGLAVKDQRDHILDHARGDVERAVKRASAEQVRLFHEAYQFLTIATTLPAIRSLDTATCQEAIEQIWRPGGQLATFGVIALDGTLLCSALPLSEHVNLADRAYFKRALATRDFAVGDYQVGRVTHRATINFGYPVLHDNGEVSAVAYVAVPLSWIHEALSNADLPEGSTVTLIDRAGTMLEHYPDPKDRVEKSVQESTFGVQLKQLNGDSLVRARGLDGEERFYLKSVLRDPRGRAMMDLVVGVPTAGIDVMVEQLGFRYLAVLLVVLATLGAIAWWGGEIFVLAPILSLTEAAKHIGAGRLGHRAPTLGKTSELAALATAFNTMASNVEERDRDIRAASNRVARLNRVYAVLSAINGALLRIRDRDALLAEACRIAVELGQFRVACIWITDEETRQPTLVACDGVAKEVAEEIRIELSESSPFGIGPTATALRNGTHVVIPNIATDSRTAAWAGWCSEHGVRSAGAFPLKKAGRVVGVLSLYAPEHDFFDDGEVKLLLEVAADTSMGLEFIEKESRLEHLAFHDIVTGLPNKRLFEDRLGQAISRYGHRNHRATGVAVLAITNLRRISDTIGNHAGDELLRKIGSHLGDSLREGDTVASLATNEFGIILSDVASAEDVILVTSKLFNLLPRIVQLNGHEFVPAYRMGVSVHARDGRDPGQLISYAGLALAEAQMAGAPMLHFYSAELGASARKTGRIERALTHAIERQELALHYQPIVELASGNLSGFEALLRWTHPALGPVRPDEFIGVAEETGLIIPIGLWVFQEACRTAHRWQREESPLSIAVNVSVVQIRDAGFVPDLLRILDDERVDLTRVRLGVEITESRLAENAEHMIGILARLRQRGLSVSIDDFGTGYSSLSYLQRLPVDVLKIDRSFVQDLETEHSGMAMIRAIVGLARGLGLRVVAEGVETDAEREILRRVRCSHAQGYLFAKPMPAFEAAQRYGLRES